jgi:putative ABC transport system permease protein
LTFLLETIRLGLSNLRLHKLRSLLTAMGIILGVAAVITMVAVGEGGKRAALLQIEQLGAKNIILRSVKPAETTQTQGGQQGSFISKYGLTRDTLDVIRENFPDAEAIVPLKEVGNQVLKGDRRIPSQSFGTVPDLMRVAKLRLDRGRYLTEADVADRALVCVIGPDVAKQLFPYEDALGQTLRIDDKALVVVGILAPVGLAGGAGSALVGRDLNKDLHLPITTVRAVFGDAVFRRTSGNFQASEVQISEVYFGCPTTERVTKDAARLKRIIDVRHRDPRDAGGESKDVTMIVPYELLEQKKKQALTYKAILAAIAGISLLIGGIGIMNIMLASVTERTREIGIRRALGATRKHIVWQFLVETGVLSTLGGVVGVALGIGASALLGWGVPLLHKVPFLQQVVSPEASLPTAITLWSVVLSFAVAAATGLIFGIYPARKAAGQDPIVALRHD